MSMLATLAATGVGSATKTYIEDVFSTYTYTGTGATQTITNGIDLAGKGGMVLAKARDNVSGGFSSSPMLFDTVRGANKSLATDGTGAEATTADRLTSFLSSGFTLGADAATVVNKSTIRYASWTFRKAAKFFDCGTYTGTGAAQTIAHALGQTVGWLFIKRTSGTGNWAVFARTGGSAGSTTYAYFNSAAGLNLTAAASASSVGAEAAGYITSTGFKPNDLSGSSAAGNADNINESGAAYVWYAFTHDASTDGLIQCGSYNGSVSNVSVNLGFEPQFVMIKCTTTSGSWMMFDNMRGVNTGGTEQPLYANLSNAEGTALDYLQFDATGFTVGTASGGVNSGSQSFIYLAIRRGPMKPPTSGTQVYGAYAYTANGTDNRYLPAFSSIVPDLIIASGRSAALGSAFVDRLRGFNVELAAYGTSAEFANTSTTGINSTDMGGVTVDQAGAYISWNNSTTTYIWNMFKRYPGVFDQVCYTGAGSYTAKGHNLTVSPELMITRKRSAVSDWMVTLFDGKTGKLNTTDAFVANALFDASARTSTTFNPYFDGSGETVVAYLFATLAGISKCGVYTGNGTSQTIDCGFAAGARFVLIKCTTAAANWIVFDTVRGIVAAADPHLFLNLTDAEGTGTDWIDPHPSGFTLAAGYGTTNNAGDTYIYLAFA